MAGKKTAQPSPESIARANRQRLAMEEGARAMADIEQQAIALRKNMERLRALGKPRKQGRRALNGSPVHHKEEAQAGAFEISGARR